MGSDCDANCEGGGTEITEGVVGVVVTGAAGPTGVVGLVEASAKAPVV